MEIKYRKIKSESGVTILLRLLPVNNPARGRHNPLAFFRGM
jgi:hypothetical protein